MVTATIRKTTKEERTMMNAVEKMDEVRRNLLQLAYVPEPTARIWSDTYAKRLARHRELLLHVEQYCSELDEVELVCTGRNVSSISKQQYKKLLAEREARPVYRGEYVSILSGRQSQGDHEYFVYFSPTNAL